MLNSVDLTNNPLNTLNIQHRHSLQSLLLIDTSLAPEIIETLRLTLPMISTVSLSANHFPDSAFMRCVEAHLIKNIEALEQLSCDRNKTGYSTHTNRNTTAFNLTQY